MINKRIMSILVAGMVSLSVVGCGRYKVKNEDAYNKGYYKYAVTEGVDAISSDYSFYSVIYGAVDSIQSDVNNPNIYDNNGKYLYTINEEDYLDYEYGILKFAIDRTKEEKEKDLHYIFNNSAGKLIKNTEEAEKIIEKYNDAYIGCYDELLDLLEDIESKYGKEDISRDYLDKVNDIKEKQEKILYSYSKDIMKVYGIDLIQGIFNN